MADGVSIVLEHPQRSVTQRALWTAVLVALQSSLGRRETGLRAPMTPSMLCVPSTRPADLGFTTAAKACTECGRQQSDWCVSSGRSQGMLGTLHNHAVGVVVDKLEVKCSSSRTSDWRSHPSCMVPSRWPERPQKGRRCSPSSVWAASSATLAFPICDFDHFVIGND